MNRKQVVSTNIASVGYDESTQTLEVGFLNGTTYQYSNVPKNIHNQFMQQQSKGRFFNTYVKNHYSYSRL